VHAGAVVQMAGYNSTYEALAGGIRPILLPRRSPRREQAIRASRLAALGLADVLDDATTPSELAWLLGQDRSSDADRAARAGVRLDGAERAAELVRRLVDDDLPMPPVEAQRPIVDDVHAGDAGRVGRVPDRIARALVG
jgi:predicted glycosyltransferase